MALALAFVPFFAGLLLQNLFQTLQASKEENEYVMKAIMRVILSGQENLVRLLLNCGTSQGGGCVPVHSKGPGAIKVA